MPRSDDSSSDVQLLAEVDRLLAARVLPPLGLETRLITRLLLARRRASVTVGERLVIGTIVLFVASYGRSVAVVAAAAVIAVLYATMFPLAERRE